MPTITRRRPPVRQRSTSPTREAAVAVTVVVAAVGLSLAWGSRSIPLVDVLAALFTDVDSDDATVITSQRLPRTVLGLAVGTALGMAGALMQGHTRNPLADPGLFGVNAGASFAVAVLVFTTGAYSPTAVVVAALAGAAAVSVLVFVAGLGGLRGGPIVMLAIFGTAATALLSALTSSLQLLDADTLDTSRYWEVGSIAGRDQDMFPLVLVLLGIGAVLAVANGWSLNTLGLGDSTAQSLGQDVRRARVVGIAAITLLAGASTAICGPIAFLGLVAPHVARLVAGHDYRRLVPLAGVCGAVLLLVADTVGRVVAFHGELQAGIVMSAIGAPVLLAITRRRRLVSL